VFGWVQPLELRIAALQALDKLDPDWVQNYLPRAALTRKISRSHRWRFPSRQDLCGSAGTTRVRLQKPVRAVSINLTENCSLEIKTRA